MDSRREIGGWVDGQRFWGWPWKKNGNIPSIGKELGGKPAFSCSNISRPTRRSKNRRRMESGEITGVSISLCFFLGDLLGWCCGHRLGGRLLDSLLAYLRAFFFHGRSRCSFTAFHFLSHFLCFQTKLLVRLSTGVKHGGMAQIFGERTLNFSFCLLYGTERSPGLLQVAKQRKLSSSKVTKWW